MDFLEKILNFENLKINFCRFQIGKLIKYYLKKKNIKKNHIKKFFKKISKFIIKFPEGRNFLINDYLNYYKFYFFENKLNLDLYKFSKNIIEFIYNFEIDRNLDNEEYLILLENFLFEIRDEKIFRVGSKEDFLGKLKEVRERSFREVREGESDGVLERLIDENFERIVKENLEDEGIGGNEGNLKNGEKLNNEEKLKNEENLDNGEKLKNEENLDNDEKLKNEEILNNLEISNNEENFNNHKTLNNDENLNNDKNLKNGKIEIKKKDFKIKTLKKEEKPGFLNEVLQELLVESQKTRLSQKTNFPSDLSNPEKPEKTNKKSRKMVQMLKKVQKVSILIDYLQKIISLNLSKINKTILLMLINYKKKYENFYEKKKKNFSEPIFLKKLISIFGDFSEILKDEILLKNLNLHKNEIVNKREMDEKFVNFFFGE